MLWICLIDEQAGAMGRAKKMMLRVALSGVLIAALAMSSTAQSSGSPTAAIPPPPPGGFTVKGSNDYSIFVFGVPARRGKPAAIAIFVTGKKDGAFYSAPATVTETSIQADLGGLGEISVAFQPNGHSRTVRPKCADRPASFAGGSYVGTIDFHGEEGYTTAEAAAARGDLGFLIDGLCLGAGSRSSTGAFLPGAQLTVSKGGRRLGTRMQIIKNHPKKRAHYEVQLSEKQDGISIARFAGTVAPGRTFEYDPHVQTATVRPPAPFSGVAHFHRDEAANRWTGNLTVDLPGKSDAVLTGPGFRAGLVHGRWSSLDGR
jgi:hypothetical protein